MLRDVAVDVVEAVLLSCDFRIVNARPTDQPDSVMAALTPGAYIM